MKHLFTRQSAMIAIIVLPPLLLLYWIRQHVVNIPFWDEWDETAAVVALHRGTLRFSDLWAQHNEHRILTSRLTLLGLDALLHRWNAVSEIFISITVALLTLAGLVVLAFRSVSPMRALALGVVFSLLIFSIAQYENWTWGFEIAWFYVNASLVWSIIFLTTVAHRLACFIAAAVLAAFATVSMATGPVVWVSCALVIALTPGTNRWRRLGAWLVFAALAVTVYSRGFVFPGMGTGPGFARFDVVVSYAAAYVGSPFAGWLASPVTTIVGGFAIVVSIAAFGYLLRDPDRSRMMRAIPWLALSSFGLACAAITALGRAPLGAETALSSRYITVSQYIWIGLIGFATIYSPDGRRGRRALIVSTAILLVLGYVVEQVRAYPNMLAFAWNMENVRERLIAGTATDAVLQTIYPDASVERRYVEELRAVDEGPLARDL